MLKLAKNPVFFWSQETFVEMFSLLKIICFLNIQQKPPFFLFPHPTGPSRGKTTYAPTLLVLRKQMHPIE